MGHKVHPYGFRIGIIKPWLAKWYADRDYATLLQEDMRIRGLVAKQLSNASVSQPLAAPAGSTPDMAS